MKTTRPYDDGIKWLRQLRRKIAAQCGHDLAKQSAFYRQAAAKLSYTTYKGESPAAGSKRRFKLAA